MPSIYLNNRPDKAAGFSLVELMVAMVLGLLILAGVIQVFVGSRMTFNSNEAVARVQENGRFAIEVLRRPLREAGMNGFCAGDMNIRSHLNSCGEDYINAIFDPNRVVTGWEAGGTGRTDDYTLPESLDPEDGEGSWSSQQPDGSSLDLPDSLDGRAVEGSDVLFLRTMRPLDVIVDSNQNNTNITLESGEMPQRAMILISNCSSGADWFQQSGSAAANGRVSKPNMSCTNPGPGNAPPGGSPWSTAYNESAQVLQANVDAYYIGFNADRQEPGLYRLRFGQGVRDEDLVPEELVSGVENLQVLYGFSLPADEGGTGQTVNLWLSAEEVPDWNLVIAVRVALLLFSPDNADMDRDARTFELVGTEITTQSDARLRQVFSATSTIRNSQVTQ